MLSVVILVLVRAPVRRVTCVAGVALELAYPSEDAVCDLGAGCPRPLCWTDPDADELCKGHDVRSPYRSRTQRAAERSIKPACGTEESEGQT